MAHSELKEMLEQVDVEDFLSHLGVDMRIAQGSSGVQANIKECPRCGGNSWKVYLGIDTGLGNCFHGSCVGEPGFNLFTFAKHLLGNGKAAYQELEKYIELTGWIPVKKKARATNLQTSVKLPKSFPLPIKGKNLKYLSDRNISLEVTEYLGLRFCKSGRFDYTLFEKDRYQVYDNRIIIPIFDMTGDLVTFQGRDITNRSDKKYLFPPGLAGTGKYLYNAHNVIGLESIVIAEGAFDVAAVIMAFEDDSTLNSVGVVGSFGKSLSTDGEKGCQLTQLFDLKQKGLRTVTFMWDGEPSAIKAACKQALHLRSFGFDVRLARLPDGKDPNEISKDEVRLAFYRSEPVNSLTMAKIRLNLMI
ncbi:DNA primase catalytic core, N-terminal domain protein [Vibrio coralliirubri]|uniref:toprim domain-containing protein n=1 Tax=Vibrio coralliirubri TaxID=1516159 RepID=UPI0006390B3C|nr:toprim domain-containing protein [Vibrio coralliirubri]CDT53980.1 DNA primase catalytic core, N-terminal domain protein [Vibrio coralliirubri]